MYQKIEKEFNFKSEFKNDSKRLAVFTIVFFCILFLVFYFFLDKTESDMFITILFVVIPVNIFYSSIYIYIVIQVAKHTKKKWYKFCFEINSTIKEYYQILHKNDIKNLINVLNENQVNTRPKVLEVLRHYQLMLPRKIVGTSGLLSLFAFILSILAIVINDSVNIMVEKVTIIFIFLIMVTVVYFFVGYGLKIIMRFYGQTEFNTRMESLLSEIYIKSLIPKTSKKEKEN